MPTTCSSMARARTWSELPVGEGWPSPTEAAARTSCPADRMLVSALSMVPSRPCSKAVDFRVWSVSS